MTASQAVLPRPKPSTVTLSALHRDVHDHGWPDGPMDEQARKWRREFAARLKAARVAKRLTQKRLAGMVGVSQPTLGSWERATRPCSLTDFLAVADALGVHPASLLPGTPPPVPVVFEGPFVCEGCRARQRRRKRRIRPVMRRAT